MGTIESMTISGTYIWVTYHYVRPKAYMVLDGTVAPSDPQIRQIRLRMGSQWHSSDPVIKHGVLENGS